MCKILIQCLSNDLAAVVGILNETLATLCILLIGRLYCMQHYGGAPLPAYEPVYNWRATRTSVFGQRIPELPSAISSRLDINFSIGY